MSAVLDYPQRHAISAEEYLRMGEAGLCSRTSRSWVVDLENRAVRVFRDPDPSGRALAEVAFTVSALFPA